MERREREAAADPPEAATTSGSDDPVADLVSPGSSRRLKMVTEVVRRLRMAAEVEDFNDRDTIFSHLLADLAGEVSTAAAAAANFKAGGGPTSEGKGILLYYEAIAGELLLNDGVEEELQRELFSTFERLWASPKATLCFALVTYKLLFLSERDLGKRMDKYTRVLVRGMKHLFWSDLHTDSKRFLSLFAFLSDEVVLSDAGIDKLGSNCQLECARVVAGFSLYYFGPEKVAQIVSSFPASANLGFGVSTILDFFLKEIAGVIRKIKCEAVTVAYLSSLYRLHELIPFKGLSISTTARVQEVLFTLSQPGGPYYAPKAVRVASREAFSRIYPHGKRLRALFKVLTSILHPAYSLNLVWGNCWLVLRKFWSSWPWDAVRSIIGRICKPRRRTAD
ncbi:tRNA (adenine(37)-N6)-methyltransferase [Chloropicon roscoffensis]|uniref:tRNA (Adenine(37)-N6)-methyltransferase n=1 Tax=Chloropicon roscoffensis TaxID=1461544 RepID=A0AAX4PJP8_9CHLO